jgi:hypothetical protein
MNNKSENVFVSFSFNSPSLFKVESYFAFRLFFFGIENITKTCPSYVSIGLSLNYLLIMINDKI